MEAYIWTLLLPLAGTVAGSAFVFFIRDKVPDRLQKVLLGFASGVMVAASVWSLLIPGMEMGTGRGAVVAPAVGLVLGMLFLLFIDSLTPHLHAGDSRPEGLRSKLSQSAMLGLAVAIHNFPEGMAVGVVIVASMAGGEAAAGAGATLAMALGIAIQNVPEGAIVSLPLRVAGGGRWKSFWLGSLSGLVEPLGALAVIGLSSLLTPALPYFLGFAAGAMLYVVVEELIPQASSGAHSNLSTLGFALGFVLMMVLDTVLA